MKILEDTYANIISTSQTNLEVKLNILDPGYKGVVKILIKNNSNEIIIIKKQMKIAQMIIQKYEKLPVFEETNNNNIRVNDSLQKLSIRKGGMRNAPEEISPQKVSTKPINYNNNKDINNEITFRVALKLESKSRCLPFKRGDSIYIPINRNTWLRLKETKLIFMPIKSSKDI